MFGVSDHTKGAKGAEDVDGNRDGAEGNQRKSHLRCHAGAVIDRAVRAVTLERQQIIADFRQRLGGPGERTVLNGCRLDGLIGGQAACLNGVGLEWASQEIDQRLANRVAVKSGLQIVLSSTGRTR